jgi:cell division protein FtsB
MQIKTEKLQEHGLTFVHKMGDVRFVGQLVFAVIVLLITWSGVKSIQTNYGLQKQIATLKQQIYIQKLENTNIGLQNQYFNSNQYLELAARQSFGLANAGEKEVIVPKSVAMAYTTDIPTPKDPSQTSSAQPSYQKNFNSWVDFFLHRQAGD